MVAAIGIIIVHVVGLLSLKFMFRNEEGAS